MVYLHLALLLPGQLALPPINRRPPVPPKPPAVVMSDEQVLKAAFLAADGPALLDFFRKRVGPAPAQKKLDELIAKLGDKTPETAQRAAGELIAYGPTVVAALRPVANNPDGGETAVRARQCLQNIEGPQANNLAMTAARVLAGHNPPGTVEVLIAYLPFAEDEQSLQEIETNLVAIGQRTGKTDPALTKALDDPVPSRRAVAAGVLCQLGGPSAFEAVRPLLKDPKPTVRLKVAMAFLEARNADGVPVLIDLMAELPPVQRKQAEDGLTQIAGDWAIQTPKGDDATSRRLRKEMWQAWWRSLAGSALIEELRSRVLSEEERTAVLAHIAKLNDANAAEQAKASEALLNFGSRAGPLLRRAINAAGSKNSERMAKCLQLLDKDALPPLPATAARLLALRRPEGALETLLTYLPFAETVEMQQEIRDLLGSVAAAEPQSVTILVKALQDPVAERRAAAAQALCAIRAEDHYPAVRKLLADGDSQVRLRAALGLATLQEKEAIPVLVGLLSDLPLEEAYEAEDYLLRLAGDKAPSAPLAADKAARAKASEKWAAWWKDNEKTVDLAAAQSGERQLGFMLVVEAYDNLRRSGRVVEFDRAGKVRWEITGLSYPQFAQALPGDHVLIAEQNVNRVSERDHAGKILWEKQVPQAFHVERARNGNTFMAGRNQILEIDRNGKEVINHTDFNDTILAATKRRDGQVAYITYQARYVRLDQTGKQVKATQVPFNPNFGVFGEVLQNDHVLISTQGINKVTEYDGEGKVVFEASVVGPGVPTRLPNGHTLVPSNNNTRLVELDRTGKVLNEFKDLNCRPWRATKR